MFLKIFFSDDILGYVPLLSPIKSFEKKRPYFDTDIQTKNGKKQAVCFCKDRCQKLEELKNSTTTGCVLKNVRKNSNDILINHSSNIRMMELDFNKCLNIEITKIKTILNLYICIKEQMLRV